ncbi:MAG TPA: MucB/RseB C-terminal domain-containing protein [Usitatibacteraceae bacterium]
MMLKAGYILLPLRYWSGLCILLGASAALAAPPVPARETEAMDWLIRVSKAARDLPYSGVFVHQTADNSTTSRITHLVDKQGVELEKIEALDGPQYEIIRRNEEMFCYQPDAKTVRVDRRASGRFFPSLVSGSPQSIAENYRLRLGSVERIAGFDCQWIILEPRDEMRYTQKVCAEVGSGLLLRAKTYSERNHLLEQFMFTQLDVNGNVSRQALNSQYEKSPGWQRDYSVKSPLKDVDTGWVVGNLPAGFKKVMEMLRSLAGRPQPVAQLVFSDGMAHVSVFAEPSQMQGTVSASGASDDNPTSFAVRSVGDYQVTVMGEVPLVTVQAIADGVSRRAR